MDTFMPIHKEYYVSRSAICSHRVQLFSRPLCIYMSATCPSLAQVRSIRRDLYNRRDAHTFICAHGRRRGKKETRKGKGTGK